MLIRDKNLGMVNMAEKRTNQQEISICVANLTSRKSGISAA
jgi:hypothetical protein